MVVPYATSSIHLASQDVNTLHRLPDGIPRCGSLDTVTIPGLLRHILRNQLNAVLEITSGPATKTIYFENGGVVFAKSNQIRDRLGNRLLQTGRISQEQFAVVDERMRCTGVRFGEALVSEGWMSARDVVRQVGHQFGNIILSLFLLEDGEYVLEERHPSAPPELKVKLFTEQLLLFGARRMEPHAIPSSELPGLDARIRCVKPLPRFLKVTKLQTVEKEIVDAVGGGATLGSLEHLVSAPSDAIRRACFGLFLSGVLEVSETIAEPSYENRPSNARDADGVSAGPSTNRAARAEPSTVHLMMSDAGGETPAHRQELPSTSQALERPGERKEDRSEQKQQELLSNAELHMAVDDWRKAVPMLTELLQMAPESPKYNALLAHALGKCSGLEKHAERQFQRALQLAPTDAEIHYDFGRFYLAMGRAARAEQEFREALRHAPKHAGALQELQRRQKAQGSLGNMLRKMLR